MIRDQEIKRLLLYGKSLGVRINIRDFAFDDMGEFSDSPAIVININKKKHDNKTQLILTLLHELSHAKYLNINNASISKAWFLEEEREKNKKLPKKLRKEMADFELNSLDLMINIANELKITIPMKKIMLQLEKDKWMYSYYLDNGDWPTPKQQVEKKKELKEKFK